MSSIIKKVTADDIRRALYARYKEPEWLLGFEVGNSTGGKCRRHADAVAINTYPSRGFTVKGFEIKVSRSDLKHELDNADKAEAVAQYCNEWYLVVPKGLTENMEIPHNWGIIELVGDRLIQKKEAVYMKDNNLDAGFMCAFFRGIQRCESTIKAESEAAIIKRLELTAQNRVNYKLEDLAKYEKQAERFRKATNLNFQYLSETDFKVLGMISNLYSYSMKPENLQYLAKELSEAVTGCTKVINGIKALLEQKPDDKQK